MAAPRGDFPIEVLERILENVDGKNLLRLRAVSSIWKATIDDMLRRFSPGKWQWLCFETIKTNSLIDYLSTEVPLSLSMKKVRVYSEIDDVDLSWAQWKRVFLNHQKIHNIQQWADARKHFIDIDLPNDPISCIKVTGNLFITGHFRYVSTF